MKIYGVKTLYLQSLYGKNMKKWVKEAVGISVRKLRIYLMVIVTTLCLHHTFNEVCTCPFHAATNVNCYVKCHRYTKARLRICLLPSYHGYPSILAQNYF